MRATQAVLGGGRAFFYPKHVWTPAGGWWNLAPNGWQRNTAIAFGCIGTVAYGVFTVSASKERRPCPPREHVPSQRWAKHAAEDDPSLRLGTGAEASPFVYGVPAHK